MPRKSDTHLTVLADAEVDNRAEPVGEAGGGRAEAQLRTRVAELEERLAEVSRCLEDAERRAGELLATRAQLGRAQQTLSAVTASRSWRMTTPLRKGMHAVRGLLER